jgi:hypothetical protein
MVFRCNLEKKKIIKLLINQLKQTFYPSFISLSYLGFVNKVRVVSHVAKMLHHRVKLAYTRLLLDLDIFLLCIM